MKKFLSLLAVGVLCASALLLAPPSARAVTDNEYIGHFGVTPVGQQTGPTRTALQNYGYIAADGTTTATASGTGSTSTVTLSKPLGTITSDAITTAAAATHVMTVTNTLVASTSIITASINQNGSTGLPVITSIEPGSGSFVIRITNLHASAAFNAALKISFNLVR
jgi:hypothetical protein